MAIIEPRKYRPASHGAGKRHWFITTVDPSDYWVAKDSRGRTRWFASYEAAERGARALDLERQAAQPHVVSTPGQRAYEASLAAQPSYHDGTPRKTWAQLGEVERWSWERGA